MSRNHSIALVVRKVRLEEQGNDFAYWQTQTYESRLATLEEIRCEYHGDVIEQKIIRVLNLRAKA